MRFLTWLRSTAPRSVTLNDVPAHTYLPHGGYHYATPRDQRRA